MKKLFFLIAAVSVSILSGARKPEKLNELGVTTLNLNDFGITYRIGNDKSVWRFNAVLINGSRSKNNDDNMERTSSACGTGFQVGKERRKKTGEKFELRYGLDLSFNYNKSKHTGKDNQNQDNDYKYIVISYEPGINLVLGFNFVFAENFLVGAEFLPYIHYTGQINKDYDFRAGEYRITNTRGLVYGLSSNSVRLSLVYRF